MQTWLFSRLEFIDKIIPPHAVDEDQKLLGLQSSLQTFGWVGPPILIVGKQALTGTHRLAAAKLVGLRLVPVLELSALVEDEKSKIPSHSTREEIRSIIKSLPQTIREKYAASVSDSVYTFDGI